MSAQLSQMVYTGLTGLAKFGLGRNHVRNDECPAVSDGLYGNEGLSIAAH